ncbi:MULTISPECIES: bifunctional DNA primase/polymerase [Streptomyces]|uniref:bifunctional DNA primase/polymerase n=1 Tax=Streptomyces TaxID=1883 RepID=UPI00288486CE|nr:bifunctional DNA primase/polymerase [Streptomyces sp. DSM 41859]MDT0422186.1 bifunctional DNA primase/polymerase [Streptomyces sp. DSM 41859]
MSIADLALRLARQDLPVLPLRSGKLPFGNCPNCVGLPPRCGGRPNMKTPGPCACARPCHGWAAATINPATLTSPDWATAWRKAEAVAYCPGGAGVTVVDLDHAEAITWARATLPPTRTIPTTRGEHWIYRGTMPSANGVRPGVDIKSRMQYARWLGPGEGTMTPLPLVVRALLVREETTPPRSEVVSSLRAPRWDRQVASGCRHTERYVLAGLAHGLDRIRSHSESGAGAQAFGVARFLATQHAACPGPCGLDALAEEIVNAAVAVGVPEPYARRAVTNGLHTHEGYAA